jgi:tRNA threonylcarbamoyladenosine biosynthesis protein TsaE
MVIEGVTLEKLEKVADALVRFAGDQRILAFFGEMGAGKTTFIRSLCERLGVQGPVTSPTFSIVNEYLGEHGCRVYHFDFYRLKQEQEAIEIGLEEYLESGEWCLLEWPEKVLNLLPKPRIDVRLTVNDGLRRFEFSYV